MRESEEHRVHAEPLFRYLLAVETCRARRAGRPVLVLMVERAEGCPSDPRADGTLVPARAPGADGANGHGPPRATVPTALTRALGADGPAGEGARAGSLDAPRGERAGDGGGRADDPAPIPAALAGRVAAALGGCLRETDLLGWYAEGRALGAVLTEIAADPGAWRAVVEKVRRALRRAMPAAAATPLRLHLYRAEGPPPLRLVLTVPDLLTDAAEVAGVASPQGPSSLPLDEGSLAGPGRSGPAAEATAGRRAPAAAGSRVERARSPRGLAGEGATEPAGARRAAVEASA